MGTTRNGFLVGGKGKSFTFFFLFLKRFRLSGGDQGAFRSPPGPLRGPSLYAWAKPPTRNKLLAEGRKRVYLSFPYHKGFRLCGGDQRAFRSPFGNLRPFAASRNLYIKQLPCGRQETGLPFFSVSQRISPLRRRPKGFPIALWKPSALCCNAKSEFAKRRFLVAGRKQAFLFSAEKKLPHKQSKPPTRPYTLWEANHHYNLPNSLNSSRFAP